MQMHLTLIRNPIVISFPSHSQANENHPWSSRIRLSYYCIRSASFSKGWSRLSLVQVMNSIRTSSSNISNAMPQTVFIELTIAAPGKAWLDLDWLGLRRRAKSQSLFLRPCSSKARYAMHLFGVAIVPVLCLFRNGLQKQIFLVYHYHLKRSVVIGRGESRKRNTRNESKTWQCGKNKKHMHGIGPAEVRKSRCMPHRESMGRQLSDVCARRDSSSFKNNVFLTIPSFSFVYSSSPLRLTAVSPTKQACKYTKYPMKSLIPLRTTDFADLLWLSEHYVKRTRGRCVFF